MHNHIDAAAYVPSFLTTSSSSAAAATVTISSPSCKHVARAERTNNNRATTALIPTATTTHLSEFKHFPLQEHKHLCKTSELTHNVKCTVSSGVHLSEPPSLSSSSSSSSLLPPTAAFSTFSADTAVSNASSKIDVPMCDNNSTNRYENYNCKTSKETQLIKCPEKRFLILEEQYKFTFATLSWNVELQRILLRNATSPLRATFANKHENNLCNKQQNQCTSVQSEEKTESTHTNRKETLPPRLVHTWAEMLIVEPKYNIDCKEIVRKGLSKAVQESRDELNLLDPTAFPSLEEINKQKNRRKSKRSESQELKESNERKLPLREVETGKYNNLAEELHSNMNTQVHHSESNCCNTTHTLHNNKYKNNSDTNEVEKQTEHCTKKTFQFTSTNKNVKLTTETIECKLRRNSTTNEKQQENENYEVETQDLFQRRKSQKMCRRGNQRTHLRQILLERYSNNNDNNNNNNRQISTPNLTIKLVVPSVIEDTSRSEQLYAAPDAICEAFFNSLHNKQESSKNNDVCRANSVTSTSVNVNTRKQLRRHGKLTSIDRECKNKCKFSSAPLGKKKEMTRFMPDLYFQPWRLPVSKVHKDNMESNQSNVESIETEEQEQYEEQQHKTQFTINMISNVTITAVRPIGHNVESTKNTQLPPFKTVHNFIYHDDNVDSDNEKEVLEDDNEDDDDDDEEEEDDEIPLFQLSRKATRALRPEQAPFNKPSRKQHQLFYEDKSVLKSVLSSTQYSANHASSESKTKLQQQQQEVFKQHEHVKTNFTILNKNDEDESEEHKQTDDHVAAETTTCTPVNNTEEYREPSYTSSSSTELYHSFDFFHQMFLRSFVVIALAQIKLSERLARVANCTTLNHNIGDEMDRKINNNNNSSNNVLEPEERRALSFFYRYYDAYKEVMMKLVMRSEDEFMRRSFQQILESCERNVGTCNNEEEEEWEEYHKKSCYNTHLNAASSKCCNNDKVHICQNCKEAQREKNTQFYSYEELIKEMNECKPLLAINQLFISGKYVAWQPLLMDVFDITRIVQCYAERNTLSSVVSLHSTHLCTSHLVHAQNIAWSNTNNENVTETKCCGNCNTTASGDNTTAYSFGSPFTQNATHQQLLANSLHKFIMMHIDDIYANSELHKTSWATSSAKCCTSLEEEESEMFLQYITSWIKESDNDACVCNGHGKTYNNYFPVVNNNMNSMCNTHYWTNSTHDCYNATHSTQPLFQAHMSNNAFVNCQNNIVEQIFTPLQWCEEAMADSTLHQCGVKLFKSVLPVSRRVVYKMVIPAEDTEKYNLARFFQPNIFKFIAGSTITCHSNLSNNSYAVHGNNNYINPISVPYHQNYNNNNNYIHVFTNSLHKETQALNVNVDESVNNTLVHCSAGMHRSSGLVIAFLLYLMHTNKTRKQNGRIIDRVLTATTHEHSHINAHYTKQNNKPQSYEERAKQIVYVCLEHVRQQRQIAEPIPSVVKMLE